MLSSKAGAMLHPTSSRSRRGRGGYASMLHHALDPIPIACEIATALHRW
jgi:hypothetical protein